MATTNKLTISLLLLCVVCVMLANGESKRYNFNDKDTCKKDSKKVTLDDNDDAKIVFREPGNNIGAVLNKLSSSFPDRCSIVLKTGLLNTKRRLRVKFDSVNNYFRGDSNTLITFYDSDGVKIGKKLKTVSKSMPIKSGETMKTTGGYLTIEVSRDYDKSKKFNVEMYVEPISSSSITRQSLLWLAGCATLAKILTL